ncbi:hypothetical protein QYF36_015679 [Acer negundo]|nr:hypothetical protein QYF36_015679 [Acer negundo]
MEEEAERIYKEEHDLLLDDEAASTREAMYEQSESIERELEHMTEQIKSIIQTVNANKGGELDTMDGMAPLDVVVKILNNQLGSLMWIDEKQQSLIIKLRKTTINDTNAHVMKIKRPGKSGRNTEIRETEDKDPEITATMLWSCA